MAIEDSVKLFIYKQALLCLGGRTITVLTENHERVRRLNEGWGDGSELTEETLALAGWNHAMRSQKLEHDPAIVPSFGPEYAFQKPTDMVRMESLSYNEYFQDPLTNRDYNIEAGYIYATSTPIYIRFVSNAVDYGFDSSHWPITFKMCQAARLARKCCYAITGSTKLEQKTYMMEKDALTRARGVDAMEEGTKIPTPSRWVQARGYSRGHRDRYVES